MDNASTHAPRQLIGWIASLDITIEVHIYWLPKYASWLVDCCEWRFQCGGKMGIIKTYNSNCGLGGTVEGPPDTDIFSTEIWCNNAGKLSAESVVAGVTPFLVYRQSRSPDGVTSDWIQVSPLIEFAHWDSIPVVPDKGFDRQLNDPYIKLLTNSNLNSGWRFVFRDNYTYLGNWEYRYQFVYFDDDHRITRWRRSNWITYSPESL